MHGIPKRNSAKILEIITPGDLVLLITILSLAVVGIGSIGYTIYRKTISKVTPVRTTIVEEIEKCHEAGGAYDVFDWKAAGYTKAACLIPQKEINVIEMGKHK